MDTRLHFWHINWGTYTGFMLASWFYAGFIGVAEDRQNLSNPQACSVKLMCQNPPLNTFEPALEFAHGQWFVS